MSKHEEIIKYIISLDIGTKISVRGLSSELGVSEGTSYRAIKECENLGIVNTVPRVGTIRVKKIEKKHIEKLTFKEVVNIVEGTVIGGEGGINKSLERFIIGAMEVETIGKYISPCSLLIVGNRIKAQRLALSHNCAVLITGGFECSKEIKDLADEKNFPVISTTYDTFTVATMINKAIFENNIKKDIVLVEDMMERNSSYVKANDNIRSLKKFIKNNVHERYPVVNKDNEVVGIVSLTDIAENAKEDELVENIMIKNPIVVMASATLAYAAHIMAWEGIKLCPVVDERKTLIGVISREDVIKAMQIAARQPHIGETLDELIMKSFKYEKDKDTIHFRGEIIPEMLDTIGTASWNALNMMLSTMGTIALRQKLNTNIAIDNFNSLFMRPVQIGRTIDAYVEILDIGRYYSKVEISMYNSKKELLAKAMLSAKLLKR